MSSCKTDSKKLTESVPSRAELDATLKSNITPTARNRYGTVRLPDQPYFNPECECLVVFILNTRRRIKDHYLVCIGTMYTILCHPREIVRLAVMASAAAII